MAKYIFITGGVVSSLGKGIVAASLGSILESRGLKVSLTKLDPYINVDPGTMSPAQHGEVFVTYDGAETDLDLGHYSRFVNFKASKQNNYTTGQIYNQVIKKEREGGFLGSTVQVIPHITDEIICSIEQGSKNKEVSIVEIGGTVGDIESLPFLEAIRQMGLNEGSKNVVYIHLTLVPYMNTSNEIKTKPTQHSVKELRSIGIQPDILVCRSVKAISEKDKEKIAMFTNVERKAVVNSTDVEDIYELPLLMAKQSLDEIVCSKLGINRKKATLDNWKRYKKNRINAKKSINIFVVAKYGNYSESYKSLNEALKHAGFQNHLNTQIHYLNSESKKSEIFNELSNAHGIIVPGGFGDRGIKGKISAIEYSRLNNIPFLGICLGMQLAVIEYARNCLKIKDADSSEFSTKTNNPVIALIEEWLDEKGIKQYRDINSNKGGTMRLGEQKCILEKGTNIYNAYKSSKIFERHRHRYEFNNRFLNVLEDENFSITGKSMDKNLVEVIELKNHKWFVGCQFHPEFTSRPFNGHPLFNSFIKYSSK